MPYLETYTYAEIRYFCARNLVSVQYWIGELVLPVYTAQSVLKSGVASRGRSLKLKHCQEGDMLWALVRRVSASQSTWHTPVNQSHGYVLTAYQVRIEDDGARSLHMAPFIESLLKRPVGREKTTQALGYSRIPLGAMTRPDSWPQEDKK